MFKQRNNCKRAFTFRHFTRGGYSVFASLHREVRIGVLSIGMLASVNLPKVQAAQPAVAPDTESEADEKELAEVAVTGTMSPLTTLQSARIVSVMISASGSPSHTESTS